MSQPISIATALKAGTVQLASLHTTARLDAEVLLTSVLGKPRSYLYTWPDRLLSCAVLDRYHKLVARRAAGEPVAYLTGQREFWSMGLAVSPATLIPRPETELLVERALARIPENAAWLLADVGTGSGALALALAKERSNCQVIATDVSAEALALAERNARRHGLNRVEFRQGDWFAPLQGEQFHLIVSNPPYVRDSDPILNQGDVHFEPTYALQAGPDGLHAIRHIVSHAKHHLIPGGWVLIEHGFDQAAPVKKLMLQNGYRNAICYMDYAGKQRVSEGSKK